MILVAAVVSPGGLGEGVWTRDWRRWIWGWVLFRVERRSVFGDILVYFTCFPLISYIVGRVLWYIY